MRLVKQLPLVLLLLAAYPGNAQAPDRKSSTQLPPKVDGSAVGTRLVPFPTASPDTLAGRPVYSSSDPSPEYPGGVEQMQAFLLRQLRYPPQYRRATIEGLVFVNFVVDRTGQVQRPTIVKGLAEYCDAEALRAISLLPRFTPGRYNGEPVDVRYTMALRFDWQAGWNFVYPPSRGHRR
jgi:TonB family protein